MDEAETDFELRAAEHERRRLAAAEKVTEKSASEVFAESVFIQRKRKGWTQQQLATRLAEIGYPVHWTTVSKLEKLERKPTLEDLIAFSVALDVAPVHTLGASYLPPGTALKLTRSVAGLTPVSGSAGNGRYPSRTSGATTPRSPAKSSRRRTWLSLATEA